MNPFRVDPALPVTAMKTYAIASPKETHFRAAECSEVDCRPHRFGWETFIDESTPLGQKQAGYLRHSAGRLFSETRNENGVTVFTFGAGQECFTAHEVRTDRPEIFAVRDGDWRGNPTGAVKVHDRPEHWVEDFAANQDKLSRAQQ